MQRIITTILFLSIFFSISAGLHPAAAQERTAFPLSEIYQAVSPAIFTAPGEVAVSIPLSDGSVLVGGSFVSINGQTVPRSLAKLNMDGTVDQTFQVDSNLAVSELNAAALQPDGKILVAGVFKKLPDTFSIFLLRLNPDGSLDGSFDPISISLSGRVYSVFSDGDKIMIGGSFSYPTQNIARLLLNGTADPAFSGVGVGPGSAVLGIAKQSSGKYIVVGDFGVSRLNTNGSKDAAFVPDGFQASRQVAVLSDNSVLVGGEDICGDQLFAWYTADGALKTDPDIDPNGAFEAITAFLPLSDGGFLIGGWNASVCINGFPTQHEGRVMRFSSTGAYRGIVSFSEESDVLTMARRSDGKVLVGGQGKPKSAAAIGDFDGLALISLANNNLAREGAFNPVVGDEAEIFDIQQYSDGKLLVAGDFSHVDGQPHFGVARLMQNYTLDTSYHPFASYPGGWSKAVLALPDGRAVAGFGDDGLFLIASNGTLTDLSSLNHYDRVSSLARQSDGKILVGSSFGLGLRRIKADFSAEDEQFIPGNADGTIYDIVVFGDKIFAAGDFEEYNGESISGIILLKNTGEIDGGFIPPIFSTDVENPGSIHTVMPLSGGDVLAGGYFNNVNSSPHPSLVRLNSNGSLDSAFTSPDSMNIVQSLCVQTNDSSIWVGGRASTYLREPKLIHLDADGLSASPNIVGFGTAHAEDGSQNSLLCDHDGIVWTAGRFSQIENQPFFGLARLFRLSHSIYLPIIRR